MCVAVVAVVDHAAVRECLSDPQRHPVILGQADLPAVLAAACLQWPDAQVVEFAHIELPCSNHEPVWMSAFCNLVVQVF